MAEFREEFREDATKRVAIRIILLSIAAAENIEISAEEMDEEMKEMAKMYNVPEEHVRNMIGEANMSYFAKDMKVKKAIDLIYDNAKVTMVKEKTVAEEPAEDPAADAE